MDSVFEMVIVLLTTFVPFAIAAIWPLFYLPAASADQAQAGFTAFFAHGELSFALLGVCGAVIWIFYIKAATTSKIGKLLMGVFIATLILIGLGVIAGNPGFSKSPPPFTHSLLVGGYVCAVVLWFVALLLSKSQLAPEQTEDPDARKAKALLKRAGRGTA